VPEILEVESYRLLAESVVGATIARGWADAYLAKKLTSPSAWNRAVKGLTIAGRVVEGNSCWWRLTVPRSVFDSV